MTTIFGTTSRRAARERQREVGEIRPHVPNSGRRAVEPVFSLKRQGKTGYAVREFSHACLIKLVDYPELPLRTNTGETIKAGKSALIVRTEFPIGQKSQPVAYKRVRRHEWWKRLLSPFRTNSCLRNFRLGMELLSRGIPTARPLAAIIPDRWQLSSESYLATEWIEGTVHCYAWLFRIGKLSDSARRRELTGMANSVGDLLGKMHAAGVSHRDLKPGNVLTRAGRTNPEVFVVDLDGVTLRRLGAKLRARNVSRFVVSLTTYFPFVRNVDLLRGLKSYLQALGSEDLDWKSEWRRISGEVARRTTVTKE